MDVGCRGIVLCSENKRTDLLLNYKTDDLHLCFCNHAADLCHCFPMYAYSRLCAEFTFVAYGL